MLTSNPKYFRVLNPWYLSLLLPYTFGVQEGKGTNVGADSPRLNMGEVFGSRGVLFLYLFIYYFSNFNFNLFFYSKKKFFFFFLPNL
jgi:hypothetical protein